VVFISHGDCEADARSLEIEGKDHSTAVGAKPHRDGVLAFLAAQP